MNEFLGEKHGKVLDALRESERASKLDRRPLPRLPDSLAGFQGILGGEIVRKFDDWGFVLKLEKVDRVWEGNEAENPRAAIGKTMVVMIQLNQESAERFKRTLRSLEIGQKVLVEAFHFNGEHLTVVEQLRAVE